MALTPTGTSTPYCDIATLFVFHDWQQVADLMREGDNPRPTKMCLLDDTSDEGEKLFAIALAASGELEGAVRIANRYTPDDLAALTGSGLRRMQKVVADLIFWACSQNRQPVSADPANVPGALLALQELDRLRNGERIFGFTEAGDAGLPVVSQPDVSRIPNSVAVRAARLFGGHAADGISNFTRRRC